MSSGRDAESDQSNCAAIASWLEGQANVERVYYPGLESHPQHELASRQMAGFGAVVSFILRGNLSNVGDFMNHLDVFTLAESLGGVESLAGHPASMSHSNLSPSEREDLGQGVVFPQFHFWGGRQGTQRWIPRLGAVLRCHDDQKVRALLEYTSGDDRLVLVPVAARGPGDLKVDEADEVDDLSMSREGDPANVSHGDRARPLLIEPCHWGLDELRPVFDLLLDLFMTALQVEAVMDEQTGERDANRELSLASVLPDTFEQGAEEQGQPKKDGHHEAPQEHPVSADVLHIKEPA